jgi:hypothetical protein
LITWLRNTGAIFAFAIPATAFAPYGLKRAEAAVPPPPNPTVVEHARKVAMVYGLIEPRITKLEPTEIHHLSEVIIEECEKDGVDPLFVLAVIDAESNFDIEAVSPTGARGLMQLVPSTFRDVSDAKRMFDPEDNVRAGIRYIRKLWDAGYGRRGGPESILLAYNQGPNMASAVFRNGANMPNEAHIYIPRVMARYKALLAGQGFEPKDAKKLFLLAMR